jgi:hypothetical protein
MIANENVIRVSYPEAARCRICVKKTPRSLSLHNKIVFDIIVSLNCIFNENSMTLDVEGNVIRESKVMCTVNSESSVVTLMSTETFTVRFMNCTNHMEMDSISTNLECLTNIKHFNV